MKDSKVVKQNDTKTGKQSETIKCMNCKTFVQEAEANFEKDNLKKGIKFLIRVLNMKCPGSDHEEMADKSFSLLCKHITKNPFPGMYNLI